MNLSMVVRADDGGLGNLTWEWFRHLQPNRIMVVLSNARGGDHLERYQAPWGCEVRAVSIDQKRWDIHLATWLVTGADTLLTAETFYDDRLITLAERAGCRTVLYAMPELFASAYLKHRSIHVVAPTSWETGRLGNCVVLPLPVDRQRLAFSERSERARTFLHTSATAMLDRNGTGLLRHALDLIKSPSLEVLVAGHERPPCPTRHGPHRIIPVASSRDYWEQYRNADVLVMPRRYGGLSMPMSEALSCGMPLVTLDRAPENAWTTQVAPLLGKAALQHMKGGDIPVESGSPQGLASVLTALAAGEVDVRALSRAADTLAASWSWDVMLPKWQAELNPGGS